MILLDGYQGIVCLFTLLRHCGLPNRFAYSAGPNSDSQLIAYHPQPYWEFGVGKLWVELWL